MLEILTPLNKCHRVSRKVDPDNFVAVPGIWGEVDSVGAIANVVTDTPPVNPRLVISSASDNEYESHDIEVGRVTTLETPYGTRFKVDTAGFVATAMAQNADLVVSDQDGDEGKLAVEADVADDTYTIVARCMVYNATEGYIEAVLVSPRSVTFS